MEENSRGEPDEMNQEEKTQKPENEIPENQEPPKDPDLELPRAIAMISFEYQTKEAPNMILKDLLRNKEIEMKAHPDDHVKGIQVFFTFETMKDREYQLIVKTGGKDHKHLKFKIPSTYSFYFNPKLTHVEEKKITDKNGTFA
jgi:hypothetical protein